MSVWEISPASYNLVNGTLGRRNHPTNAFSWNAGSKDIDVRFTKTGEYQIKLIIAGSSSCGIDSITKTICIDTIPTGSLSFNADTLCVGDSATAIFNGDVFQGCDTLDLQWVIPQASHCVMGQTAALDTNQNYIFNQVGKWPISVTVINRCDTLNLLDTVVVQGPPAVALPPDIDFCGLSSFDFSDPALQPVINENLSPASLQWGVIPASGWNFMGGTGANSLFPEINFTAYGKYKVYLQASNSCGSGSDTIEISLTEPPEIIAVFDTLLCPGSSIGLKARVQKGLPPFNFQWAPGAAFGPDSVFLSNLQKDTTVFLKVVDAVGCADSALYHIQVMPTPVVDAGADHQLCYHDSVQLTASVTGGAGAYSYSWSPGYALSDSTVLNPLRLASDSSVTYVLQITDSLGCSFSDTVEVSVYPEPVHSAGSDFVVCINAGDTVLSGAVPGGGSWSGTGINSPNIFQPAVAGVGVHQLIHHFQDIFGCDYYDTLTASVILQPNPDFSMSSPQGCSPFSVSFFDSSGAAAGHEWYKNGQLFSTSANPVETFYNTSYTNDSVVEIKLVFRASSGCVDSISKNIILLPEPLAGFQLASPFCAAEAISPTNTSTSKAGATYAWSASSTSVSFSSTTAFQPLIQLPDFQGASDSVFDIQLIVLSPDGCRDTATQSITVHSRPVAGFSLPAPACGPASISPVDTSSGRNLSYNWSVTPSPASSTGGNSATPQFVFAVPAQDSTGYKIHLEVTDANGCTDTLSRRYWVYARPTAGFSVSQRDSCGPLTVNFTDTSDSRITGKPLQYSWSFGNGQTSTLANPNITFTNTGVVDSVYSVQQIVTNSRGCKDTAWDSIRVHPDPRAELLINNSVSCAPFNIDSTVVKAVVHPQANSSYTWKLYDAQLNLLNTYSGAGGVQYSILTDADSVYLRLVVASPFGCADDSSSLSLFYTIENPQPDFAAMPDSICSGGVVSFYDSSSTGVSQEWFVNDNLFFVGANPSLQLYNTSHTSDSVVSIKLRITAGGNGCSDSITRSVVIHPQPLAQFSLASQLCANDSTQVTNNSLGGNLTYAWSVSSAAVMISNDTAHQPTFYFPDNQSGADSTYTLQLIVSNAEGCSDTTTQSISIHSRPVAGFSLPVPACGPTSISPVDTSSGMALSYSWSISPSTGVVTTGVASPSPQFDFIVPQLDSALYRIHLQVTDANGCMDSLSLPYWVYARPRAGFAASNRDSCGPLTVDFTDTSDSRLGQQALLVYSWNFGNGDTSSLANPQVIFTNTGVMDSVYTIRQIITNARGCKDTAFDTIRVHPDPRAEVVITDSVSCAPFIIDSTVVKAALYPETNSSYTWKVYDSQLNLLQTFTGAAGVNYSITTDADSIYLRLVVSSLFGCQADSTSLRLFYTIENPKPDFAAIPDSLCSGGTVVFYDSSSTGVSHEWFINDSAFSTAANPSLQLFNNSHTRDSIVHIKLRITAGGNGCSDSISKNVVIHPQPLAQFSLVSQLCANDSARVSNSSQGANLAFTWSVSSPAVGISASTAAEPVFHFPDNQTGYDSTYTLQLIVTNAEGCGDTTSQSITIYSRPVAGFSLPAPACGPASISPVDTSSGLNLSYNWSVTPAPATSAGDQSSTPQFGFAVPMQDSTGYKIHLEVTDANGCTDTISSTYWVYARPSAGFTASRKDSCGPLSVQFTDTSDSHISTQAQLLYQWSFGNGQTSNLANPNVVFTNTGVVDTVYGVQQIITNTKGCKDTAWNSIRVHPDPRAELFITDSVSCAPFYLDSNIVKAIRYPQANDTYTWKVFDRKGTLLGQYGGAGGINHGITDDGDSVYVRLVVSSPFGCHEDSSLLHLFYTIENPTPDFTAIPDSLCSGGFVNFYDSSSTGVSHEWFINDSAFSTAANPSLQLFNNSHTHDSIVHVKLRITAGANGCSDSISKDVVIHPQPLAQFSLASQLCANDSNQVNNNSQGTNLTYTWSVSSPAVIISDSDAVHPMLYFPDNQSGVDSTYSVQLIVRNAEGCSDTATQSISIHSRPVAGFNLPAAACGPTSISPSDSSSGQGLSYNWSVAPSPASSAGASSSTPQFSFGVPAQDSAEYRLHLQVTDNNGCIDTLSRSYWIYAKPKAGFQLSQRDSCGPLSVQFTDTSDSHITTRAQLQYFWSFGNGQTSTLANPNITFTNSGVVDSVYSVQLIVTNERGCSDTITDSITVRPDPRSEFTSSSYLECAPFLIDSSLISTSLYPHAVGSYLWEVVDPSTASVIKTFTGANALQYSILQPDDSVIVRLVTTSLFGCKSDTLSKVFTTIPNPVPNFGVDKAMGCTPLTVNILDSSSAGVTYEWFINGKASSTLASPSFSLTNSSNAMDSVYTIKLVVTAGTGCKDSISRNVRVFAKPVAGFTAADVCNKDTIVFYDASASIDSLVQWYWDFGDGTSDTTQNPKHFYTGPGVKVVSLTTTDSRGCSHTLTDSVIVYPNPVADFDKAPGCVPGIICKGQSQALFDSSLVAALGAPISGWQWDIKNDGSLDYQVQNPVHVFTDTGLVDIFLKVQTVHGCVDSIVKSFRVVDKPISDFAFDTTSNCGPLNVNVQNLSTGFIEGYQWNLYVLKANGTRQVIYTDTAAVPNAIPTLLPNYRSDTTYYFELIAINCCGPDTTTRSIVLKPLPVAAMLASPLQGCTPLPVGFQLDGLVKGKPDYLIFDLGDGSAIDTLYQNYIVNSQGDTVWVWGQQNHTFINPLNHDTTYTVSLTAHNECGDSTVSLNILVHPNTVQAFFQAQPVSGCEPLHVDFQDASFGGTNVSWCFDYDSLTNTCNQPVALGRTVSHTYTLAGTYLVAQFVDDGCGYDTAYQSITVYPSPAAAFQFNNFTCEGDSIFFTDQSTISNGSISSYHWDFGDGDSSYLTNPVHVYDSGGVYQVKLIISSSNGCQDSSISSITIYDKPRVSFSASDLCFNEQPVQFFDSSSVNAGNIISTYWDFGDGNTSTSANPSHSYSKSGLYRVKLTHTSSNGCMDSAFINLNIYPEPTAIFSYSRLSGDSCSVPQSLEFINQSVNSQGFSWDFDYKNNPGQHTSSLNNPSFTYTQYGVYHVALFTSNQYGCKDSVIIPVYIRPVPEAGFSADTTEGCAPLGVQFQDTSSYQFTGPGGITNWYWEFGDGSTSNQQHPYHVYTEEGTYSPRLIIRTDGGCYDTIVGRDIRVFPTPEASFTYEALNAREFSFTNTSGNVDSATTYRWKFGDGETSTERSPSYRYLVDLSNGGKQFNVCLFVQNTYGCQDSICEILSLSSLHLNVPNAFTPNLETGSDANVFLPKGHELSSYHLKIFDKWGNVVFESTSLDQEGKPNEAWDGRHYINGTELPVGSYTWRIDAIFNDGSPWMGKDYDRRIKLNVGSVTLIR